MPIIINGASRRNGSWWTKHLNNVETNEYIEMVEYRGLSATTMREAFREMEGLAANTKCDNYFYQANINPRADEVLTPQQWREAWDTLERNLGLTGQPRFIIQHEKEGRIHQHCVWSRVDAETGLTISDSMTARIHEQTSRELEIKFDLERGRSILTPDRDFGRPERGPKKWETFRGAQTDIDPNEMKAELTAIRQQCDSGTSFRIALEESGEYLLARGDRRDYVIIDREGDVHSLARRVDLRAADLHRFMADIDPASLPTVEQATAVQRERDERTQRWDRDAANREWEANIENAAVGIAPKTRDDDTSKDKVPEQDPPAARGAYAPLQPQAEVTTQIEPPATDTRSNIRAALAASQDADPFVAAAQFQAALSERGIGLAAVTAEDAYASERNAAFARQIGNHARKLRDGEIIAVDGRGNAWPLDERVTRQPREVIEERLTGVDRDQLPNVEAAKEAMREANKAAWRTQKDEERARERINEPVAGARAEIRMAFALAPDGPNAAQLQEALASRGMTLAQVTADEAKASQEQATRYAERKRELEQLAEATAAGRYAELEPEPLRYSPRLHEGEIVVVDQRGSIYKLDERSTGLRKAEIESRVSGIEDLLNVTEAQATMREAAREIWKAEQAARREQVRDPNRVEARIAECAHLAELDGARVQVDADGNRVRGAEALADRLQPEDARRTEIVIIRGREAFDARLDDAGIALVRVTLADAAAITQLRQDEAYARLAAQTNHETYKGNRIDACAAGDLAAVTRWGDVYRINPGKIGNAAHYLSADLPGAITARSQLEIDREQKNDVWQQAHADRDARRDEHEAARQERADIIAGRHAVDNAAGAVEAAEAAVERGLSRGLKALSRAIEQFIAFLVPEPRLTPDQAERAERAAEERDEARAEAAAQRYTRRLVDWQIFERDKQRQQEDRAILLGLPSAPIDKLPDRGPKTGERERYERDRD